jgi:hypothetical protein
LSLLFAPIETRVVNPHTLKTLALAYQGRTSSELPL